jgi:hypothetical protein
MAFPRFIALANFEFVLRHQSFFIAGFRLEAGRLATCPAQRAAAKPFAISLRF